MKKYFSALFAVCCFSIIAVAQISPATLVNIVKAEDERRFDATLENLLKNRDAKIRARAALAAGRIGDERAAAPLGVILETDASAEVRATAAFALGEIESLQGAEAVLKIMSDPKTDGELRARVVEAAGKIAAANAADVKSKVLGEAILDALDYEDARRSRPNRAAIIAGLTAILRVRPADAADVAAQFLTYLDPRVRSDAANALARLRAKNAVVALRSILLSDDDADARANAARALGAAEDKAAFDILLEAALTDEDSRVRVSAIRSLGSLKDIRAADKLIERGTALLAAGKKSKTANPPEKSELLEIASVLGRLLPNSNDQKALKFIGEFDELDNSQSPESATAAALIDPASFYRKRMNKSSGEKNKWQSLAATAQAAAAVSAFYNAEDNRGVRAVMIDDVRQSLQKMSVSDENKSESVYAAPDVLRLYASLKPADLSQVSRSYLVHKDIIVRAAAAEVLGDAETNEENISALAAAFPKTETDKLNDASLAILDALEKHYKKLPKGDRLISPILEQFKTALDSPDYLVRRKAIAFIKSSELAGEIPASFQRPEFPPVTAAAGAPNKFRTVRADYARAVSRRAARAILTTAKGSFTIEFAPEDAPLTVDNFINLANAGYFNNLAVHRVVPNFVMQDGDPRGDGNGGPGWQIRCEINMLPFTRGAVGMALSGKDTGGSQWFATHAPQPHLDGGYTVFGRVNENDMKVVDAIVRGDKILSVKIIEGGSGKAGESLKKPRRRR